MNNKVGILNYLILQHYNNGQLEHRAIVTQPWRNITSTTVLFNKEDPVCLKPIVAAPIKTYITKPNKRSIPENFKGVVAVHRAAISYKIAEQILKKPDKTKEILGLIINAGIVDLENQIGFIYNDDYKLSLLRPGDIEVFKELKSSAGYEFRIWLIKE